MNEKIRMSRRLKKQHPSRYERAIVVAEYKVRRLRRSLGRLGRAMASSGYSASEAATAMQEFTAKLNEVGSLQHKAENAVHQVDENELS